jgi:hypothetical protein
LRLANKVMRPVRIKGITLGHVHPDDTEFQVYRPKVDDYFTVPWSATLRHETFDIWLPCYAAEAGYESWQEMQAEHPDWPLFPCLAGSDPVIINMAAGHPRPDLLAHPGEPDPGPGARLSAVGHVPW